MVAKIIISKNIEKALNYNEQKVQKGKAECIYAGNYLMNAGDMNFYQKLTRFTDLIALNDRASTNTLHISLNFDPSEKLSKNELTQIAQRYMQKIGFGDQPFLVYQHTDAGHPHIHIVTTNIQPDGSRINTHNIGRNQSEIARKEIEQEFGLVKAGSNNRQHEALEAEDFQKILYGKSETKRSITNVLDMVISHYKYTSLAELNAVVKQYNIMADRGQENGRIYKTGGLVYRVLDGQGNKIGVPIKASSIYSKPTLVFLQSKFRDNEEKRKPHKQFLKDKIDSVLVRAGTMQQFTTDLDNMRINTVLRQNEEGFIYGIPFVDHNSKCVFNGSDLGKSYSAAAIQQKLNTEAIGIERNGPVPTTLPAKEVKEKNKELDKPMANDKSASNNDLVEQLMKSERGTTNLPYELRKKKRKKRKRNLGL